MRTELPGSHVTDSLRHGRSASGSPRPWRHVEVHPATGSTNDLAAAHGQPWAVFATDDQQAGRGRLGRGWVSPPRAGIAVSYTLPVVVGAPLGWVPLLAGLAVTRAVEQVAGVGPLQGKWPNDVLDAHGRKLCGVLCQLVPGPRADDGESPRAAGALVVVGVGINVDHDPDELATPTATSLRQLVRPGGDELGPGDGRLRADLVVALADELAATHGAWARGGEALSGLQADYTQACGTLGQRVRLLLPGGGEHVGTATGLDPDGCLEVTSDEGARSVHAAGDVIHLRPAG